MSLIIKSPAKINITFEILGKHTNGYHEISSIMQTVDLCDILTFEKGDDYRLTGNVVGIQQESLITKAKAALEKKTRMPLPCHVHLNKVIPISAGLGGGSSNAAATLVALNYLYELQLSDEDLMRIGITIGADVPFFIQGGTKLVEGIGDKISDTDYIPSRFYFLARPHKRVSTKEMYQMHDKTGSDFLTLAVSMVPEIIDLLTVFDSVPYLEKGMSGSGPTVFCGVHTYWEALKLSERLSGWNGDCFITRPISCGAEILRG